MDSGTIHVFNSFSTFDGSVYVDTMADIIEQEEDEQCSMVPFFWEKGT